MEMSYNDMRFYVSWGSVAVITALALVIYYIIRDVQETLGLFFVVLGIVLFLLSLMKPTSVPLAVVGGATALLGIVILAFSASINPILITAGVVLAVGVAVIGMGIIRSSSKRGE